MGKPEKKKDSKESKKKKEKKKTIEMFCPQCGYSIEIPKIGFSKYVITSMSE